jgi:hypothetical protein
MSSHELVAVFDAAGTAVGAAARARMRLGGEWVSLGELAARLAGPCWEFVPDGRRAIQRWFAERP